MALDIIDGILRYMKETNFFGDQKKLDTAYYLMQGLTYREIAEKIGSRISYVQRVMDFLRNNGLLHWGRWSPNVYKIGMKKSIAFLDWEQREMPVKDNRKYATYASHVQTEETKVLVVYTYPEKDEDKIKGDIGEQITPFYYTNTRFTVPFFKRLDLVKEFFDIFDSMDNNEKILMGSPSFETNKVDDHPITVYICKYSELLPELTAGMLTEKLEQDFKDYKEIDINFERVRNTLNKMKEEEVIFPKNLLYLKPLSYQASLVKICSKEIYKVMGTFNEFNMLTRVALTNEKNIYYFYIQYPFYQFSEVMEILDKVNPAHRTYIETKFILGETIWYKWSLEKFLESRSRD